MALDRSVIPTAPFPATTNNNNTNIYPKCHSIPLIAPAMARPPGVAIRFDEAGGDRQPPQEKSFLQKYVCSPP